jgi:tartrate dehydratase beta subunit/fumarate hydratase class I family protein
MTLAQQLKVTEFPFIVKDSKGNQIYFETSNGYWCKYEYDSEGNNIYEENSNKEWMKREFDSKRFVIYYENSYGSITDKRSKSNVSSTKTKLAIQ